MSSPTADKFCTSRWCGRNDAFSLQFHDAFDPRKMKKRRKLDAEFAGATTTKRYQKQKTVCCTPKTKQRQAQGHRSRSLKRRNVECRGDVEPAYNRDRFVEPQRHRRESRRFVESSEDEAPRRRHLSKRAEAEALARYEAPTTDDDNDDESLSMPWQWTAAVDSVPDPETTRPVEAAVQSSFSATQLSPVCDASILRQVSHVSYDRRVTCLVLVF